MTCLCHLQEAWGRCNHIMCILSAGKGRLAACCWRPDQALARTQGAAGAAAATSGRRHPEIKPETDAGMLVWAKTPRYPWWPAQARPRLTPACKSALPPYFNYISSSQLPANSSSGEQSVS